MDRRGLLSMVRALALAGLMGVGVIAAEQTKTTKAACACCGVACTCPACTCDTTAKAGTVKAGKGCDCCADTCCTSSAKIAKTNLAIVR